MIEILKELRVIEARVSALIQRIEAEAKAVTATVGEIRRLAILEEVYRKGGKATPQEISDLARKYHKTQAQAQVTIQEGAVDVRQRRQAV